MLTYNTKLSAIDRARRLTRAGTVHVVVEGPEDDTWTVMPLTDAIDGGFLYSWYVP